MTKEELIYGIIDELNNALEPDIYIMCCETCEYQDIDFDEGPCEDCNTNSMWAASEKFKKTIESIIDLIEKNAGKSS